MPIQFTCPHCGVTMNVDPAYAGQTGPCSKCGEKITIPAAKPGDLPPFGGYGAPAAPRSSTGCIVASLVLLALGLTFAVCGGAFFFAVRLPMRVAAQSTQSNNNLKQIGIALHNYHDVFNSFPPAYVTDADGNKLYSWRVLILPFLGHAPLYEMFDKNKAWDSSENIAISNQIVDTFTSPGDATGKCSYYALTGKGTAFSGDKPIRIADVFDGLSNTLGVVEVCNLGRSWAEPYDIDIDTIQPVIGFAPGQIPGPEGSGMIHALRLDGSIENMISPLEAEFRAKASIAGGEVIPAPSAMAPPAMIDRAVALPAPMPPAPPQPADIQPLPPAPPVAPTAPIEVPSLPSTDATTAVEPESKVEPPKAIEGER